MAIRDLYDRARKLRGVKCSVRQWPGVGRAGLPSPSLLLISFFYLYFMTDANYEDTQTCASLQLEEWEVLEVRSTIQESASKKGVADEKYAVDLPGLRF